MSKKNRRPPNLPYPNEWLSFQALSDDGETLTQYRIQDLTPSRFEDAVKHMTRHFLSDEPLCQSRKLRAHPRSICDFQDIIRSTMLENKMTIACFREGSNDIVGMNILCINRRDDGIDMQDYQCPHINDIRTTREYIMGQVDLFDQYSVSKYLTSLGVSVSPYYRNRGVARKLLEAQQYVAKSFGISLYSNLFTSEFLQKCANSLNYDKNYEITYENLAAKGNVFSYPNITSECVQIRSCTVKLF
ncbi:uncharacterized protein LOC119070345 [Bradysia coprophila]|uniref:uncharacterized protein LOC119070345 n=1 Tax=Bradysia coprophila TaxID=38358 RepID=UPI00187DA7F7|nr:uncharacterized protein LOC119070345 [Bradysia coprophila]